MEFGIRELIQFGTLLASLAGAFAVVKSQLARVIQDIKNMSIELQKKPKLILPSKPKRKTNIPLTKEQREAYLNTRLIVTGKHNTRS